MIDVTAHLTAFESFHAIALHQSNAYGLIHVTSCFAWNANRMLKVYELAW